MDEHRKSNGFLPGESEEQQSTTGSSDSGIAQPPVDLASVYLEEPLMPDVPYMPFPFLSLSDSDDDETIAIEEAMEQEMDPAEEITLLAQDMGMSVEELQATIGPRRARVRKPVTYEEPAPTPPKAADSEETAPKAMSSQESSLSGPTPPDDSVKDLPEHPDEEESELKTFYLNQVANPTYVMNDSEDEDTDYQPLRSINRDIRVGPNYQAEVTGESSTYNPSSLSNEDIQGETESSSEGLMWKPPTSLSDSAIMVYMTAADAICNAASRLGVMPAASTTEYPIALQYLMKFDYNPEAALKQLEMAVEEERLNLYRNRELGCGQLMDTDNDKEEYDDNDDDVEGEPLPKKPRQ